jgi:signal peptidase I
VIARSPAGEILLDGGPSRFYRVRENHFFVLGDNRDDSLDSRVWGFVPFDSIVGRAMLVYWSVDESAGMRWTRAGTVIR